MNLRNVIRTTFASFECGDSWLIFTIALSLGINYDLICLPRGDFFWLFSPMITNNYNSSYSFSNDVNQASYLTYTYQCTCKPRWPLSGKKRSKNSNVMCTSRFCMPLYIEYWWARRIWDRGSFGESPQERCCDSENTHGRIQKR